MTGKTWRSTLEGDPAPITHREAFSALVKVCADAPQHAQSIRDVMGVLARYRLAAEGLREAGDAAVTLLGERFDTEAMNLRHNLSVFAGHLDALNPPEPDFDD
ncbi:hypothetical protein AACH06_25700 [Ideonella sp. DXS29W]|uniref:Uncharacterized protein n=1 Tax=Ideonella lacteola TaxID=2984193 RepID=A0ABU9C068_9BURK